MHHHLYSLFLKSCLCNTMFLSSFFFCNIVCFPSCGTIFQGSFMINFTYYKVYMILQLFLHNENKSKVRCLFMFHPWLFVSQSLALKLVCIQQLMFHILFMTFGNYFPEMTSENYFPKQHIH